MTILYTNRFRKDCKKARRRQWDTDELLEIADKLHQGEKLPPKYYDHPLKGELKGCRCCHIWPDWLLIYWRNDKDLILERTGSHSDLFE